MPSDAEQTRALCAGLAPTGGLHASINLDNPVLAQGNSIDPSGVTVDIAVALARRLGVPVAFECFDAARKSFMALTTGPADIGSWRLSRPGLWRSISRRPT